MKALLACVVLALGVTYFTNPSYAAGPGYHIVQKYKLGGEGGWDYLKFDPGTGRLFISRSTHVVVIKADDGKIIGEIADTPGVHGIALAPELNRGFTSNGGEGTVSIFDLKTLRVLDKVKVGQNPDAILYDPSTRRVFTMNGRSDDASAVDAADGKVAGTVALGGKPEFAVSDGEGHVYVNLEDKSELLKLDSRKLTVISRWPLAPCESPSGLAIDREHHRLFSGCHDKVMAVVNTDTGKVITTLPIGAGVDAARYDAKTKLAFASCGDGTLTVIHEDSPEKFSIAETVTTQRGARTMALDDATGAVFLVTADFGPPPAPTAEHPHPWPTIIPNSFVVLVAQPAR